MREKRYQRHPHFRVKTSVMYGQTHLRPRTPFEMFDEPVSHFFLSQQEDNLIWARRQGISSCENVSKCSLLRSGLFIQWIIGPAEDDNERIVQFLGITASVVSITKVDFDQKQKSFQ